MEASSPLAAMQPSSAFFGGHYGYQTDSSSNLCPRYGALRNFEPTSFNFKDLAMKKSQSDSFTMRPVRGSSPTASLAADLSQNFHIDQSPQLPTPRRALFPNQALGGLHGRDTRIVTTPPVPSSSSPGPTSDSMDISPLPHKMPFQCHVEKGRQPPSPDTPSAESSMLSVPTPSEPPSLQVPQFAFPPEKRKYGPRRPSLSRTKGVSIGPILLKPSEDHVLPPFRFGNGTAVQKTASASRSSLSEAFDVVAGREKPPLRSNPLMPPPRRQLFPGFQTSSRVGSPLGHVRKNSNPMVRPRKQFRRSLSMFEYPDEIMNEDKVPPLPPIMDIEAPHVPQLPHSTPQDASNSLPRISKETLVDVLNGRFNQLYEKFVIIDCRFEYEFEGGHIDGAVNFNDKEQLSSQLFDLEPTSKALLIFHCEYSAHRAPIMAKFIRNKDRTVNADRYPHLTYPETYILDGGYSAFFKDYQSRCFPQNYVEMGAQEHAHACERGLGKIKQRSKLTRAQTFAFGQQSPSMDDSPTAISRSRHDSAMEVDFCFDKHAASNSFRDRRVISY